MTFDEYARLMTLSILAGSLFSWTTLMLRSAYRRGKIL